MTIPDRPCNDCGDENPEHSCHLCGMELCHECVIRYGGEDDGTCDLCEETKDDPDHED